MNQFRDNSKDKSTADSKLRRWLIAGIVFVLGLLLIAFALRGLWRGMRDTAAAQTEHTYLRDLGSAIIMAATSPRAVAPFVEQPIQESTHDETAEQVYEATDPDPMDSPPPADAPPGPSAEQIAESLDALAEINPDFVGWIIIAGTTVNYPVVRGRDNSRYLHTTFSGTANPAGAIFMDYRGSEGFAAPASLIHGHNMRDGSMFGSLTNFLRPEFLADHPEIFIVTAEGETLVYHIFATRRTDAWDRAYTLDFNSAEAAAAFFGRYDTERFLILSTCLGGTDRYARLLIFAALVED
ncbi:MAG: class B sortase [Oscillospiraceae bacterium]|nr:class B sortase [Oscillospiraceae bacterium]